MAAPRGPPQQQPPPAETTAEDELRKLCVYLDVTDSITPLAQRLIAAGAQHDKVALRLYVHPPAKAYEPPFKNHIWTCRKARVRPYDDSLAYPTYYSYK